MTDKGFTPGPVEALAEAWASIDGKLEKFRDSKGAPLEAGGHYDGYMEEAKEMIRRLRTRGFDVVSA